MTARRSSSVGLFSTKLFLLGFYFFGVPVLQPYYGTVTATTLYAFCGKDVDYIVVVIDVAKYSDAPAIAAIDARSAFCSNVLSTQPILFYSTRYSA
jgi:hypothetical protein